MKQSLYGYTLEGLQQLVLELGYKKFNGEQILRWLYQSQVTNIDDMSDVSVSFREVLKETYTLSLPEIIKEQVKESQVKWKELHDAYKANPEDEEAFKAYIEYNKKHDRLIQKFLLLTHNNLILF